MRAKLKNISEGWGDNAPVFELVFEISEAPAEPLPVDCDLTIKKWHSKRTLDANAKYWQTIGQLSALLDTSKTEVHNMMLNEYGAFQLDEYGKPVQVILKSDFDYLKSNDIHVKPLGKSKVLDNGVRYDLYFLLKNSGQMDAQEFAKLTDGAISELENLVNAVDYTKS